MNIEITKHIPPHYPPVRAHMTISIDGTVLPLTGEEAIQLANELQKALEDVRHHNTGVSLDLARLRLQEMKKNAPAIAAAREAEEQRQEAAEERRISEKAHARRKAIYEEQQAREREMWRARSARAKAEQGASA